MSSAVQAAYKKGFEAAWKAGGCHWAKHHSQNGDVEWLRVVFQDFPHNADMGGLELAINDTMPCVWLCVEEITLPFWQWRHENSRAQECGSKLSVCGENYKVDSIERNHRGRVKAYLKHIGCCSEYDPAFDEELSAILCDEDDCIDLSEPAQPCPAVHNRCAPRCGCPVCQGLRPTGHHRRKMPWRLP